MTSVLVLAGPTAAGKTDLAMAIAPELGAEIVICDSMQVYRGMDIGTAKPTTTERSAIRHHCLDLVEPSELFSAADFQRHARAAIDDIVDRGRIPLLVGGTGLYIRAAIDDVDLVATADPKRRAELEGRPLHELVAWLRRLDPGRAERTDLRNARRVVRAVESALDGAAAQDPAWIERRSRYQVRFAVVTPAERAELYAWIERRVDRMLATGWADEVTALVARSPHGRQSGEVAPLSRTAREAIGYRELDRVRSGELDLADAVAEIVRRTKAYARRQLTWFRAEPRSVWFEGGPGAVAADVWAHLAGRPVARR